MRRQNTWRILLTAGVILALTVQATSRQAASASGHAIATLRHATAASVLAAQSGLLAHRSGDIGSLSVADVQRLAQNANQHIIIILRDQHPNLPARGAAQRERAAAIATDQQSVLSELSQVQAPHVNAYSLINAVAATVSPAEAAHLKTDPQVQAVVPDRVIYAPRPSASAQGATAGDAAVSPGNTSAIPSPSCTNGVSLEPEALQLTNTAFTDTSRIQAQNIVTGTGVKVAYIAEGIDINNPDFIRPDGSHVFVDYQDFSGDGPNAPTGGGEAFGDASSIAAQGRFVYDISKPVTSTNPEGAGVFVHPQFNSPSTHCRIRILGMAPGASLVGLKVFGATYQTTTSAFVQAIQYAVQTAKVDVLNESFGGNPFPDNANDPTTLANDAAVAAGVTVVASSGDAGTAGTLGSPSTDPNVIESGATFQFRAYAQSGYSGFQLSNGDFTDNNIASFSSAGFAETGTRTVDAVAPGDSGWALCTPDPATYTDCTDFRSVTGPTEPARVELFGGTSESAPLTAGEAALIIQAYRQTHGNASPSPALIKTIIKSTATDLGIPSDEQGAGLINSLKAVRAAEAYRDANGSPTPRGNALLVSPDALGSTDTPGAVETYNVQVTNSGAQAQAVTPTVQTLGAPIAGSAQSYEPVLDTSTAMTFIDSFGRTRYYVKQTFTVPAGAQRLDAAESYDTTRSGAKNVNFFLLDPRGRYTAYTRNQGVGNGYGHVDVTNPVSGTWTAVIFTPSYNGAVHFDVASSRFTSIGTVTRASGTGVVLQPGQTGSYRVTVPMPSQPGDTSAQVVFSGADGSSIAGAVPLVLRALVPLSSTGGSFTGTLTGGNGRPQGSPVQTFLFDVPSGLKDLDLNLSIADNGYNLEGLLVDPNGLPIDIQSTQTGSATGPAYTNTMQFFRRDPQPGRWRFLLVINYTVSGQQTSLPFNAAIAFNRVAVEAGSVPMSASTTVPQSATVTIPVTVTNTGNTAKDFFIDPRLITTTIYSLGGYQESLPLTATETQPLFVVPSEADELVAAAESFSPTVPISMDLSNGNGAAPYGGTGSPDIEATTSLDPFTGNHSATVDTRAPEVVPGLWFAIPAEVGPFSDSGPTPSTVATGAVVDAQQFDSAAVPSTGDGWNYLTAFNTGVAPSASDNFYKPLTLGQGQQGTINIKITPGAAPGTVVHGFLYVDTFNTNSAPSRPTGFPNLTTYLGDELVAIPYTYTVGSPAVPTGTATVAPTATATVSGMATMSATGTSAAATGTSTGTAASETSTAATATATATGTPVPATSTGTAVATNTGTSTGTSAPATSTSTSTSTTAPPTSTSTSTPTGTGTSTGTAVPATSTSTAVPATSTSTSTAVPATSTSTSTAVPATSTGTSTSTSTPPGTDTGTAVSATGTSTAVPATSTSTATSATGTPTETAGSPTASPSPVCQLFVLPVFATVPRGGAQALVFETAPGAPITATIRARYPTQATLFTLGDPRDGGTSLTGTHVSSGYRYTFRAGSTGLTVLLFAIPRDARQGTVAVDVAAKESCGLFKTVVTFEVRGTAQGSGASTALDGRAQTLAVVLPRGNVLPASANTLLRRGVIRVVMRRHGTTVQRVLLVTYHPRSRPAPHTKGGPSHKW